ncbi:uroporphyrinogen-III C-methyltransferase [Prochlorococcus sp. MIT 1223]|uniref:uroporphyrinogen-III C-methyltransferase n=1 Tax=Prochlorococcus sp. MIT 1223 TaxID=3096217 RepID=UPI002A758006|nr:uroporphyrinogen-III C-methyltransferase [Prochlorococcus sp. MIT 1223]
MNDTLFGTVYLVGAGPGDPDLLTVKAQRLISNCDAIVYDSLVPNEILSLVKASCECIFVGKRRNKHSVPQPKTNELLLELVKSFKCIVRLKGGDPFVFGRGGEEAAYLSGKGVSVEVVPGVTSGIAASAYMGIPLTHRLCGSSVTFVTGHEGFNKKIPSVNWKELAKSSDSIVIYMGVHNLRYIVEQLLINGLNPLMPVAVIQQATVKGQRYLKSTLAEIVGQVEKEKFESPAIVIVGSVVNYQVSECAPTPSNVTMPISF